MGVQVTDDVKSCIERSEYVPVALNGSVVPLATLRVTGVTIMDESVAAVTVRVTDPDFPVATSVAVIVTGLTVTEVASPLDPAALLTVATAVLEDVHFTDVVRSCFESSE